MTRLILLAAAIGLGGTAAPAAPAPTPSRQTISRNGDWLFQREGAKADDSKTVPVPSSFEQHEGIFRPVTLGTVGFNLWGGPGFGFWESQMAGATAYGCNSSGLIHSGVPLYVIMGLNYESTFLPMARTTTTTATPTPSPRSPTPTRRAGESLASAASL